MNELDILTTRLQLKPHPEGGFYRETYRDKCSVEIENMGRRSLNFSPSLDSFYSQIS